MAGANAGHKAVVRGFLDNNLYLFVRMILREYFKERGRKWGNVGPLFVYIWNQL